jgi:hypothetical protein
MLYRIGFEGPLSANRPLDIGLRRLIFLRERVTEDG